MLASNETLEQAYAYSTDWRVPTIITGSPVQRQASSSGATVS